MGKTKVFLKDPKSLFRFEEARAEKLPELVILLQRQTRGAFARKAYKRLKAAVTVQKHFKAWSARVAWEQKKSSIVIQKKFFGALAKRWFVQEVEPKFGDLEHHPKLGKGVKIAAPSSTLKNAYNLIKEAAVWWRIHKMVSKLSASEMTEMRAKVAAYDVFHNQKPWDPSLRYTVTHYVEREADDARKAALTKNSTGLYGTGDSRIIFSTDVLKVHHTSVTDLRSLIVTDNHIIKADYATFKIHKTPVPLSKVTGISLSKHADTLLVIQMEAPERDIVVLLNAASLKDKKELSCQNDRLHQLVMVLRKRVGEIKGSEPPVLFQENSIVYNNTRTEKKPAAPQSTVSFQEDSGATGAWPLTRWTKGPKNNNTVRYPKSNDMLVAPGGFNFQAMSPRPSSPRGSSIHRGNSSKKLTGRSSSRRSNKGSRIHNEKKGGSGLARMPADAADA